MLQRTITGLDLGSYSLKAAVLSAGLRHSQFLRFEEAPLPSDAPPEEREAAIFSFIRDANLPLDLVITAFPADRLTQRHLRFPLNDPKRVRQAVPFEVEGDLPLPLEGLLLGHEQVLTSPQQTDVLAILCPRPDMASYLNTARQAGFEPRIVEAEGSSLANLSSVIELSDVTRVLLDIGHRKTTLALLVDGRPAVLRALPIAGEALTEALSRDLGIELAQAQEYKHAHGVFAQGSHRPVGPNVGEVLDRLAREVIRSVQSNASDALQTLAPSEIVLMGGSAHLVGLPEFLTERGGFPCRVLEVPERDPAVARLGHAGPAFAQAAALALRGAPSQRVTTIDLRQAEFAYEPDLSDLRGAIRVAVALAAVVLLLWVGSLWAELASISQRADVLRRSVSQVYQATFPDAPETADAYEAMESRVRETRERAAHLGVTGRGLSGLDILREISERIPPSLDVALTELKVEHNSVQARGFAKDFESVDKVRKELTVVEWVRDVRLSDVVNDPRRGGKTFNLTIRLQEVAS